jgi:DNA-binding beta-propeller fold protein YncE
MTGMVSGTLRTVRLLLILLATASTLSLLPLAAEQTSISTVAGTGQRGYSGDGGPASRSQINNPYGIAIGSDGALYICDTDNHVVRKVSRDGTIATVAGNGRRGYSGDGRKATEASLNEPYEVRFDRQGNLYVVERMNHVVRLVDARTGLISTVAGNGKAGFSGDEGPAVSASLHEPHSIQLDGKGNLYVCDIRNHRIRRVNLQSGIISTFAGTGKRAPTPDGAKIAGTPLNGPRAIDFDKQGNLWLALREGNAVYKLDLKRGRLHHVAGTGVQGFSGNGGPAKLATLSGPKGLSVGPNGNIYLTDTESHSVRMIDIRKQTLELIAGTGDRGDGPEGDPKSCKMSRPHGVFAASDGAVYVGDSEAHRVRVIRQKR